MIVHFLFGKSYSFIFFLERKRTKRKICSFSFWKENEPKENAALTKWLKFSFYELNRQTRSSGRKENYKPSINMGRRTGLPHTSSPLRGPLDLVPILNAQQRKFFNAIYVKGRKRYIPAIKDIHKGRVNSDNLIATIRTILKTK